MIDVTYFRKNNPNYARPRINELARSGSLNGIFIFSSDIEAEKVKHNGLNIKIMSNEDLMICSQTVYE
jgi:hypothetical protein